MTISGWLLLWTLGTFTLWCVSVLYLFDLPGLRQWEARRWLVEVEDRLLRLALESPSVAKTAEYQALLALLRLGLEATERHPYFAWGRGIGNIRHYVAAVPVQTAALVAVRERLLEISDAFAHIRDRQVPNDPQQGIAPVPTRLTTVVFRIVMSCLIALGSLALLPLFALLAPVVTVLAPFLRIPSRGTPAKQPRGQVAPRRLFLASWVGPRQLRPQW